jgi:hypothetical protein
MHPAPPLQTTPYCAQVLTIVGIFFAMTLLVLHPGVTDAGKRMSGIFLTVVVLSCSESDRTCHDDFLKRLFLCIAFATGFATLCALLPLPSLAVSTVHDRLEALKQLLLRLLDHNEHGFALNEEVSLGSIERLLADLDAAMAAIASQLPYVQREMLLLRWDFRG